MQVGAVFALGADGVAGELFAFALVAEVEGVGEFAGVAFFAEAALVVWALVLVCSSLSHAMAREVAYVCRSNVGDHFARSVERSGGLDRGRRGDSLGRSGSRGRWVGGVYWAGPGGEVCGGGRG